MTESLEPFRVKGKLQKVSKKTWPGRMYPREVWERELKQYEESYCSGSKGGS